MLDWDFPLTIQCELKGVLPFMETPMYGYLWSLNVICSVLHGFTTCFWWPGKGSYQQFIVKIQPTCAGSLFLQHVPKKICARWTTQKLKLRLSSKSLPDSSCIIVSCHGPLRGRQQKLGKSARWELLVSPVSGGLPVFVWFMYNVYI